MILPGPVAQTRLTDFAPPANLVTELLAISGTGDPSERAMPSDHVKSGWHKNMLGRYALAAAYCAPSYVVIDLFCGLGWGAWLLRQMAGCRVFAYDVEPRAVAFARAHFADVSYRAADCLATRLPVADVVCAMEAVEHLTPLHFKCLVEQVNATQARVAVLSSVFPQVARSAPPTSPSHVRLYSQAEVAAAFRGWRAEFTADSFACVLTR
jgi:trans-aconitate methyltransferase